MGMGPWADGDGGMGMAGWDGRIGRMGWLRPYRFFNLDVFEYAFVLVFLVFLVASEKL